MNIKMEYVFIADIHYKSILIYIITWRDKCNILRKEMVE